MEDRLSSGQHANMLGSAHSFAHEHEDDSSSSSVVLFQCVLVGEAGVGKSSFLMRFAEDQFTKNISTSIGIDYRFKTIQLDDTVINLQIWDTAGQETYKSMSQRYFKKADGILLLFDLSQYQSFDHLNYWLATIRSESSKHDVPVLLVGNKSDLYHQREVTADLIQDFTQKNGIDYVEASAKNNENVILAFFRLAQKMLQQRDPSKYARNEGGTAQQAGDLLNKGSQISLRDSVSNVQCHCCRGGATTVSSQPASLKNGTQTNIVNVSTSNSASSAGRYGVNNL